MVMNVGEIIVNNFCDFHVHSEFSYDGHASMEDMCKSAIDKGLSMIVFTDHIDAVKDEILNLEENIKRYLDSIEKMKYEYGNKLVIKAGYEFSAPHRNARLYDLVSRYPFEYRMCSVHEGDKSIPISDIEKYTEGYLNEVMRAIQSGDFDTLGHIDLLRRFYGSFFIPKETICKVYEVMIAKGMALEVNTHSFKNVDCIGNTDMEYVALWKECGGRQLLLGSDAHYSNRIAEKFDIFKSRISDLFKD